MKGKIYDDTMNCKVVGDSKNWVW